MTWCSAYGAAPAEEGPYAGVTPIEACCICGGGTRESRRKSRKMEENTSISLVDTSPSKSDASIPSLHSRLTYATGRQKRLGDERNRRYASQRRNLELSSGRIDLNFESCTFKVSP
jgi:hypothetical protein